VSVVALAERARTGSSSRLSATNTGSRAGVAGRPLRWRAASIARFRRAPGLRAGMPSPWRVNALRSDGQVVPSSAAAAFTEPSRSARARRPRRGLRGSGWAASLPAAGHVEASNGRLRLLRRPDSYRPGPACRERAVRSGGPHTTACALSPCTRGYAPGEAGDGLAAEGGDAGCDRRNPLRCRLRLRRQDGVPYTNASTAVSRPRHHAAPTA
jgi:hypothetical protein